MGGGMVIAAVLNGVCVIGMIFAVSVTTEDITRLALTSENKRYVYICMTIIIIITAKHIQAKTAKL